jgi:hypothetical protein
MPAKDGNLLSAETLRGDAPRKPTAPCADQSYGEP